MPDKGPGEGHYPQSDPGELRKFQVGVACLTWQCRVRIWGDLDSACSFMPSGISKILRIASNVQHFHPSRRFFGTWNGAADDEPICFRVGGYHVIREH